MSPGAQRRREIKKRNRAIVADYLSGMRYRQLMEKYGISGGGYLRKILLAAGVEGRIGGPRIWVNKRTRDPLAVEVTCSGCGLTKPSVDFPKTGLRCIKCNHATLAIWREKNRERVNRQIREWMRNKKRTNPKYRAICSLRARLVRILGASGKKKSKKSVVHFLGIDRKGFISHIESLMLPGMTWENRSVGVWHLDHIIPCYAFDHSDPKQVLECWHYTNFRPLWGPENLRKYNKIPVDLIIGPKMCDVATVEKLTA